MWVKICGVTRSEDLTACISAGADAVGLNFWPHSKRFLSQQRASEILASVADADRGDLPAVAGVFVNEDPEAVARIADNLSLDIIQLHGDESPADAALVRQLLPECQLVRAFRVSSDNVHQVTEWVRAAEHLNGRPDLILLDAHVPGEYGGTGRRVDTAVLSLIPADLPPVILAGGLTPDNVRSAAAAEVLFGVDTAGGVEASPGVKDHELIRRFVQEAKSADR